MTTQQLQGPAEQAKNRQGVALATPRTDRRNGPLKPHAASTPPSAHTPALSFMHK